MNKFYLYIIFFILGVAIGIWLPRCDREKSLPPLFADLISMDTTNVQKPAVIYIAETIRKGSEPTVPSIIMPADSNSDVNWNSIIIIDSLRQQLKKDSVVMMYRDTQIVNNNVIYLGFNAVSMQFEPTKIQWSEQQQIITRIINKDNPKWYKKPFFIGSVSFFTGIATAILIKNMK